MACIAKRRPAPNRGGANDGQPDRRPTSLHLPHLQTRITPNVAFESIRDDTHHLSGPLNRGPHSLQERRPRFSYRGLPVLAILVVFVATLVGVVLLVTVVLTVMLVVTPVLPTLTPVMSIVVVPVAAIENLGNPH